MIVSPQEAEDIQIRQSTLRKHKDMGVCGTSLKDMKTCGGSPKYVIANQKQVIVSPRQRRTVRTDRRHSEDIKTWEPLEPH